MFVYKAMYKFLDEGGVHGEILDFPGVITWGGDLDETRRLLASALTDMAETNLLHGESLPQPEPNITDPEADLEEPIRMKDRMAGLHEGTGWMSDDFDAPLPDEFWAGVA